MKSTPTAFQFRIATDVPVSAWLANFGSWRTRRVYHNYVADFLGFADVEGLPSLQEVDCNHVLAWRRDLERRGLSPNTIRRKLSSLSSLFNSLHAANLVPRNPVENIERPIASGQADKSLTISDYETRALLAAPNRSTLQGLRDRAIMATLLYHGLRRTELCALRLADLHERGGMRYLQVRGRGNKVRYVLLRQVVAGAIRAYLEATGLDCAGTVPLFRPVSNNTRGTPRSISPQGVQMLVAKYASIVGIEVDSFGPRVLRALALGNTRGNSVDIGNFREWKRHTPTAGHCRHECHDATNTILAPYLAMSATAIR